MLQIIAIDPLDKTGFLMPFMIQRLLDFARLHYTETPPEPFARSMVARLTAGDPNVLLLAAVGSKGDVVGHAVGSIESFANSKWVFVSQCRVDPGEGSADPTIVKRFIEAADQWATSQGVKTMLMASPRSDEAWRKRYGFTTLRHVMSRAVGAPIGTPKEG
jgi:hypothetical protein